MTQNEKELICLIRESKDPACAIVIAVEVICEFITDQRQQAAPLDESEQMY